jgi:aldehyde:ferredoxin oxidoreductase
MNGYRGEILRVDLSRGRITTIPTSHYEPWVGGHGMGSAIFFDLVKDKTIDGFDPTNMVTIMTSPLSGTLIPAGAARTEVQGIGVQSYPIGWFTRSNFGGRFSTMLKQAGWDGIVLEGIAARLRCGGRIPGPARRGSGAMYAAKGHSATGLSPMVKREGRPPSGRRF